MNNKLKERDLLIVAVLYVITLGIYGIYLIGDWIGCIDSIKKQRGKNCDMESLWGGFGFYLLSFIYCIVSIFFSDDWHESRVAYWILIGICILNSKFLCTIPYVLHSLIKFKVDMICAVILGYLRYLACLASYKSLFDSSLFFLILAYISETVYFVVVQNMFNKTKKML